MIDESFITKVERMAHASQAIALVRLPGDRPGRRYYRKPDGELMALEAEPGPRTLKANTLAQIIDTAAKPFDAEATGKPLVCYGFGWASLIFNHQATDERLIWSVPGTREFDWFYMAYTAGGTNMDVAQAVQSFDLLLRETMPDEKFLGSLGKLRIVAESDQRAERDQSSSLTGGLEQKRVAAGDALAAGRWTFRVMPFQSAELTKRLPLDVEIRADLDDRTWLFYPVDASFQQYVHAAQEQIGDRLRAGLKDTDVPVVAAEVEQAKLGEVRDVSK